MTRSRSTILSLLLACGLAAMAALPACSDYGNGVPPNLVGINETPTWDGEIGNILTNRCAECHGNPPVGLAPQEFRLDKYNIEDDTDNREGAYEKAQRIRARVVLQSTMPPDSPLPIEERVLIDNWVLNGAPRK